MGRGISNPFEGKPVISVVHLASISNRLIVPACGMGDSEPPDVD